MDRAERRDGLLTRLADLGMSLAEDLHARALAAKDDKSANDLALAFHRISRSVRQTLALEARFERDAKLAAREEARQLASETLDRVQKKRSQIRRAISRDVWSEYEGDEAEALLDDLDAWVFEASEDDGFLDDPAETLIARIRENLGLAANDAEARAEPDEAPIQQSSG
jgi:hypothetical protein